MESFDIGNRTIGPDEPTYVIAEAGSNHNGDLETAKELIAVAADAGADAVKFQTFRAEDLYVDDRDLVDDPEDSTYALLESLEQPYEWIPELYEHCHSRGVQFMSSPFDERSAAELAEYVPAFKIASFTLSHHPFLEKLAQWNKPVIMSTGAHSRDDIEEAVKLLRDNGITEIALLHCVSSYPTQLTDINVRAVSSLYEEFDTAVGFSDHTVEPAIAPSAAVSLGASIVEKHFTLDNDMEGPDHSFAVEPDELNEMVTAIRQTEEALGDGQLRLSDIERETANRARRILFAATEINTDDTISEGDVQALRPGQLFQEGFAPKYKSAVVGSTATENIKQGEPLSLKNTTISESDVDH